MLADICFIVHVTGLLVAGFAEVAGRLGLGRGSDLWPRELPWAEELP